MGNRIKRLEERAKLVDISMAEYEEIVRSPTRPYAL